MIFPEMVREAARTRAFEAPYFEAPYMDRFGGPTCSCYWVKDACR